MRISPIPASQFRGINTHVRTYSGGKIPLLHIAIKFQHIVHRALLGLNPSKGWCYSGEADMHIMPHIVKPCQEGTTPRLFVQEVLRELKWELE